ncbi:hypothetical protein Pelo_7450 [Pelomyxa schiedti]|nr:hypothetical protein Pelo_7450 [Pelomyxa schiedti]
MKGNKPNTKAKQTRPGDVPSPSMSAVTSTTQAPSTVATTSTAASIRNKRKTVDGGGGEGVGSATNKPTVRTQHPLLTPLARETRSQQGSDGSTKPINALSVAKTPLGTPPSPNSGTKTSPPSSKRSRVSVGSPPVGKGHLLPEEQQRTLLDRWRTLARIHSVGASLEVRQILNQVSQKLESTYYHDIHSFLLGIDETMQQDPQSIEKVLQLVAHHQMEEALGLNLNFIHCLSLFPLQHVMSLMTELKSNTHGAALELVKVKMQICVGSVVGITYLKSLDFNSLVSLVADLVSSDNAHELTLALAIHKLKALKRGDFEYTVTHIWRFHRDDVKTLISLVEGVLTSCSSDEVVVRLFQAEKARLCTLIALENSPDKILLETQVRELKASEELLNKIIWINSCSDLLPIIKTKDVTKQTLDGLIQPFEKVPTFSEVKTYVLDTKLTGKIRVSHDNQQLACDHPDIFVYDPPRCCKGLALSFLAMQQPRKSMTDEFQPSENSLGRWVATHFGEIFHAWWSYDTQIRQRSPPPKRDQHPEAGISGKARPDWWFSLDGHVMTREKSSLHSVSVPQKELSEKTSTDAWFVASVGYIVTYVSVGQYFQPCVTFQEEGEYHTRPLGPPLNLQLEEDKVKIFIFSVNVCRLIKTFDVFHRIPLLQPIELKNSPNCVVTLTIDRQIQKKILTTCGTFSVETFYSIYEKVLSIEANLQPFIIHAIECPSKPPPTSTNPKKGASSTANGSAAAADNIVCPEWVTVTLAPIGDQRYATDELELFVAAVSTLFALAGLHGLGIAHRDVRWANVVFNPQTNAWLLIDLEFAAEFGTPYPHRVVLTEAPVDETCSAKSDVFMVGTMLLKTPFCKVHPEMFPRVATWAKTLAERDQNKRPATTEALQFILENPPPTANKESVLDASPVLAALLDFDADNDTFHLKRPLGNGTHDVPVNNMSEDEEDSDTGAENETRRTTDDVEEEENEKDKDEDVEADDEHEEDDEVEDEVVLSASRKGNKKRTGKQHVPPSKTKKKTAASSSSSSSPKLSTRNDRKKITTKKTKNTSGPSPLSSSSSSSFKPNTGKKNKKGKR